MKRVSHLSKAVNEKEKKHRMHPFQQIVRCHRHAHRMPVVAYFPRCRNKKERKDKKKVVKKL